MGHCLGTLNPHKEEGVRLVKEMLRQVVELHPGSTSLHIGADEVRPGILILLELKKSADEGEAMRKGSHIEMHTRLK